MSCSDESTPVLVDSQIADGGGRDISQADVAVDVPTSDDVKVDDANVDTARVDGGAVDGPGTDAHVDVAADLPHGDLPSVKDLPPGSDLPGGFMGDITGVWLIGWTGGLRHYSWLRLTPTSSTGGDAMILDGSALPSNTPYWACSGKTTWNLASKPRTIQLHFPSGNCSSMRSAAYTFGKLTSAGAFPKGALWKTTVKDSNQPTLSLEGFRFPLTQCDAKMTSCTAPF
ncbi:MAG: hypothetical protein KAI47_16010 [Deltaproteobacteria bacterium]|nr:hypothetical protein [Deltaproteobacteria bacterium]